jgi:transaldolase
LHLSESRLKEEAMMTKLQQIFVEQGQSPWLDNLTRGHLLRGELERLVAAGIRGVTSNPTIFAKAISASHDYEGQFKSLIEVETNITEAYWKMVIDDIRGALAVLRRIYDVSRGGDGFVSVELAPALAQDTAGSIAAARGLHERVDAPNLFVKIPATPQGVPAIHQMIAEGRNINITLIFSLERYDEVIEAYLSGLETYGGDLHSVHSVASFFVSRVDTEVDRRLEEIGTADALALRGRAAVAQAKAAYQLFRRRFSGPRWDALAARGARLQRPLWASTSTKNPAYPDTLYVDRLIGPDTINTLPEATITAFEDHGTVARTIHEGANDAERLLERLETIGVSMTDVGRTLEEEGAATFSKSFDDLVETLESKRAELRRERGSHV